MLFVILKKWGRNIIMYIRPSVCNYLLKWSIHGVNLFHRSGLNTVYQPIITIIYSREATLQSMYDGLYVFIH